MKYKTFLGFVFIFIVSTNGYAIDQSELEVEYSKIEGLKKPQNFLEIKKLFVKPSCIDIETKKMLPVWIGELDNLEELNLGTKLEKADRQDCNLVVSIPADLSKLKKLRKFIVDAAFGKQGGTVASTLKMPASLEVLSLNRIGLKSIPKWIFDEGHLKHLTIQYGDIHQIPPEISQLKALETLDLLSNQVQNLPIEISKLESLKIVNLSNNNLSKQQQAKIRSLLPNTKVNFENEWDDSRANAD